MTISQASNPYLFVCGVPRSGTTLLQRMVNSHPELAVANDTHFIPRALELTSKELVKMANSGIDIPLSNQLANNVFSYHRFYRTEIGSNEFSEIRSTATTYQQLVTRIFDHIARKSGKALAGEKTPDYVRRLRLLNGMFPNSKLVHLIRDGRSVALSLQQWATPKKGPGRIEIWNENPVAVCALWWKWLVDQGHNQAMHLDESVYYEIKYEKLTEDPETSIRQLCEFIDLTFDYATLEYNKGKRSNNPELSAKNAWLGPKTGLRKWENDMPPSDIELFEALAGDTLQRCGYELSFSRYSANTSKLASRINEWWQEHFLCEHSSKNKSPANGYQSNVSTSVAT